MSERDESRKTPDLPVPPTPARQTETRLKSPPSEPPAMGDLDDPSMWDAPGLPEVVSMRPRLPSLLTDDDIKAEIAPPGSGPVRTGGPSSANQSTLPHVNGEPKSKPGRRLELVDQGDSLPPPTPGEINELVGQLVDGRYQVENVLGVGSMGIVYVARHLAVGKRVALKVLREHLLQDQEVGRRFAAEATAATAIGNAHIVDTLDYGTLPNGCAYIAMEFLEGQTVTEALRKHESLPLERILRIARQVAVALGAAHDAGIVHRDLKPDNVFLVARSGQPDFVKILDFGIAKFGGGQNKLTHAGAVFGTPHYMAPEQALGKATDARTDLYALGVIMYEMAAGRVPFDGDNPISVLTQHATEPPTPLSKRARGLPRRFEQMVMRCLAKDPQERFASMAELVKEIDKVSSGVELPAPSVSIDLDEDASDVEALRPSKLKRALLAFVAVGVFAGAGYGALKLANEPAPPPVPTAVAKPVTPLPPFKEQEPEAPAPGKDVALVLFPLDAHAVVDGKDLGQMPVSVKVVPGQPLVVKVIRDGFYMRKVKVDGSQARVKVILAKRDSSKPPPPDALDDKGGEALPEKDDSPKEQEKPPEKEQETAPAKPAGTAE